MEKEEIKKLFKKAISTWGTDAQTTMLFEEIGELTAAMAQYIRGRKSESDVITELADVSIMVEQIALMLGYDKYEEENRKLIRLEERLKKYE